MISLEEALGLSANAKKCGEEHTQRTSTELKVVSRRRRVFELRCLGYKIPDVVKKLAEENQFWSEDTVFRDLHSDDAKAFLEELHRQQFADITLTSSRRLKLEFRDRMIERFTPRRSPESVVNVQNSIQVDNNVSVSQLLEHYQVFKRETNQGSNICKDDSEKPVDKAEANSEAN